MSQEFNEKLTHEQACVEAVSWKPEVYVDGGWYPNGLRFRTETEAKSAAQDVYSRWMLAEGFRAAPSGDEPTYEWVEGQGLRRLSEPDAKPILLPAQSSVE